jgi:RNA polymerase sigma-70 factor (ECF subfamily)
VTRDLVTDHAGSAQSDAMGAKPAPDFRAIFDAHLPYVWKTLRRLGVRQADLADVAHDVFVVVVRRLSDFDATRPIKPWLFGIAYRVASDHRRLRRNTHELPMAHAFDAQDPAMPADEQLASAADQRLVRGALAQLEDERRAVFVLFELDAVPIPEVAEALGIPLNTAYSRLRLARADFRDAVLRLRRMRDR